MQRKHIKRGELLAYRDGTYGPYAAAIVLDTSTLWSKITKRDTPTMWKPTTERRPGSSAIGYTNAQVTYWGYLTARAVATHDANERAARAEALTHWLAMIEDPHTLTPDTVAAMHDSMPDGLQIRLIDARHLAGPWEATVSAYDHAEAAQAEERKREAAERIRCQAIYERTLAAWRERFGANSAFVYDHYTTSSFNAHVPLEQLAALLGVDTTES